MKSNIREFFKTCNICDVMANKKELFIIVYCYDNIEVKLNYGSYGGLSKDLLFLNKIRRNEI